MPTAVAPRLGINVDKLRHDLREEEGGDLRWRRATIGLSLLGMAAMTPVVLLQTGLVRHLPDPRFGRFNSDKTNLSDAAFRFGVPDGALALASLALNIPLAALGASGRARKFPWLPILAAGKAALDAVGAAAYFYRMASGKEPWCPYCITGAVANFGLAAVTLPEAGRALDQLTSPSR